MIRHQSIDSPELQHQIRRLEISYGGNIQLKIYGTLRCKSGKRMKKENRIFFRSEVEAQSQGYRPCGHCMKAEYYNWKNGLI